MASDFDGDKLLWNSRESLMPWKNDILKVDLLKSTMIVFA